MSDVRRPTEGAPLLSLKAVTLQYKTRDSLVTATYRVDFQVFKSDRYILLGPSGCGKSTILKAVGGFIRPTEGQILLNGKRITRPGPDRMMVFQEFDQLAPWKTVRENILFPMRATGKFSRAEAQERTDHYIEKIQLEKFADAYPHTLSGGMKQRVAIARGMAMEPDILLMDEPFAALDALTRDRMQDELLRLWEDTRVTLLFVTHSISEAIKIGNRILLLSALPGQVKAEIGTRDNSFLDAGLQAMIHDILFSDTATAAAAHA
ncbi:ABC transporter [Rhodomicrobium udaipurense JA643]|uniref:ABC transporter ATP-binding protein n=1 Tax=Rhodomicrobium udaipurense TaxID=1202716 RepID=A0A8I1KJD8_9HYPH|nr:ABC transporter ATP-binding protein [Rhodomicrobium udaipurense]KAI95541.1 ABC transporter [Rhodomicrobium udaipurense JA643]MBJ7542801.1 ABC transporter ATP-binding protein [Rhodomicrobium udaipurense]